MFALASPFSLGEILNRIVCIDVRDVLTIKTLLDEYRFGLQGRPCLVNTRHHQELNVLHNGTER